MDARAITAALGGSWAGHYGLALCPVHGDKTPSLKVKDDARKTDGIDVHCFAGCPWQDVKTDLKRLGLLSGFAGDVLPRKPITPAIDSTANRELALTIWQEAEPLIESTLGWYYLTEHRGVRMSALGDLSHALRWLGGDLNAIVALMTEVATGLPCGAQRIFVSPNDGTKLRKWMLGNAGAIRLSPDQDVTLGLGICEGVEDALTALQGGWSPMWAAGSAGAIAKFPVLDGIEALTIFRDDNAVGIKAAEQCAMRWHGAGREVYLASLKDNPE